MKLDQKIRESRLAPIVFGYVAVGWVLVEVIGQLIDRGLLPEVAFRAVFVLFICGVPAAFIVAWFHGAKGDQKAPRIERWLLLGIGMIALVATAWVVRSDIEKRAREDLRAVELPPTVDPRRIAVLYFDDASGGELAFLADGLTESLIQELSRIEPLHVISRNGVKPYRDRSVPVPEIADALQVGTLVEGRVAQSGDRVRIDVALVDGESGEELETTRLDHERGDLFELQDTVAVEVATFLRTRLGEEIQLRESRALTRSSEAWELYQRAERIRKDSDSLFSAGEEALAMAEMARADSLLGRAEVEDERWIKPPTLRGQMLFDRALADGRAGDQAAADRFSNAGLELAGRAVAMDSADSDALELRGKLRYLRWAFSLEPDKTEAESLFASAESDLRAAVAENPAQAGAWSFLSHLLINKAALAEAKLAALRAYEADAYLSGADALLWRLYTISYDLEDAVQAKYWCEEGRERFSEDPRFKECQIWSLTLAASPEDITPAWQLLADYVEEWPPESQEFQRLRGQLAIAGALARAGLADSARSVAERSRAAPDIDPTRDLVYFEAFARTLIGDHEEAFELLTVFLATNPQRGAAMVFDEGWWFRALQADPRWDALAAQAR